MVGVSPEDIEDRIANITWGGSYHYVSDICGNKKVIIIKSKNSTQKGFVSFIYKSTLKEAVDSGVLLKRELGRILNERGLWTPDDEMSLSSIKDKIKELTKELSGLKKNSRAYKRAAYIIESKHRALRELENRKSSMFSVSAEAHAEEARSLALVYSLARDENDRKIWYSWEEFGKEKDTTLIGEIVLALAKDNTIPTSEIREVARSPQWRYRWIAAKNNAGDLFGKPIIEFDINQQNLLYWSQIYDSIYESPEPPPDSIIENDEKLDRWLDVQNNDRKKKVDKNTEKLSGSINVSNRVARHGEIFIVTNPEVNPNAPTIEEVEKLNTPSRKKFKEIELNVIKEKKHINEKDLRHKGNKAARRMIGSTDAVIDKKSKNTRGGKGAFKQFPGGTIS